MPRWQGGSGIRSTAAVEPVAVLVERDNTPMQLFWAGNGGVLMCVFVAREDDRIVNGSFDGSFSS